MCGAPVDFQNYRASLPMSGIFDKEFDSEVLVLGKRKYNVLFLATQGWIC